MASEKMPAIYMRFNTFIPLMKVPSVVNQRVKYKQSQEDFAVEMQTQTATL